VARHITGFLKKTDRLAKTIIFCVDQEHAAEMRRQLRQLNQDLEQQYPNYITRITSDEGKPGKTRLDEFTDVDKDVPTIVTTSKLLTTGVDVPTCKNIVIARVVNSIVEFKQIIGRGTRLRDDYGKLVFNILDYTKASRLFEDPEFDGDPTRITEEQIDSQGNTLEGTENTLADEEVEEAPDLTGFENLSDLNGDELQIREEQPYYGRKYYVDEGRVEIVAHLVYELDPHGNRLKMVKYTDYTAEQVRTLYPNAVILREKWSDPQQRQDLIKQLEDRGIDLDHLRDVTGKPGADPFDLLCHLAFNAPLRTRRERAARVRQNQPDFFDQYGPLAQDILNDLLDKYTTYGMAQFVIPDILKVPPISDRGTIKEIADSFSGPQELRNAVNTLQQLIYAA
jgi:type I restriction enzyme R subunit